jgi:hypothetical protein
MSQETAVEWVISVIDNLIPSADLKNVKKLLEHAKEIEKKQIMKAYDDGAIETMKEQEGLDISKDQNGEESGKYYNEKYNK